jgi:hypothetical protein
MDTSSNNKVKADKIKKACKKKPSQTTPPEQQPSEDSTKKKTNLEATIIERGRFHLDMRLLEDPHVVDCTIARPSSPAIAPPPAELIPSDDVSISDITNISDLTNDLFYDPIGLLELEERLRERGVFYCPQSWNAIAQQNASDIAEDPLEMVMI